MAAQFSMSSVVDIAYLYNLSVIISVGFECAGSEIKSHELDIKDCSQFSFLKFLSLVTEVTRLSVCLSVLPSVP